VQGETTLSGAPAAGKAQNIKPKLKSKVRYLLSCPYAPVPPPLQPPSTAQRNELKGSQNVFLLLTAHCACLHCSTSCCAW
jgi:hypothetical protein